ncbi:hypothetical protein VHEMI10265 [[Torrubiella] hemipterigena]|uniref:Extracellular membrane protein CFEM domain-containing protein n=1 Tax=[Torrubiella] hemipterigena TaxID=1531966 RepID=A0A0A1TCJ9_9HYPO|nr:hypothetical protein VHEMI10265 [[Torrubiella] hemipterigena]
MSFRQNVVIQLVTLLSVFNASVSAIRAPSQVTAIVPKCAQECAESFLRVNYNFEKDVQPSLETLCTQTGLTEYTLGEALMQCLNAEVTVKYCSQQEVNQNVVFQAYHICENVPRAIKPTHGVITATLALAPTGGVMTFPAGAATRTKTSQDLITETSQLTFATSLSSSTRTPGSGSTDAVTTPTSSPTEAISEPTKLSKSQITGVTIGSIVGAVCLIGIIALLIHYCRQRRKAERGSHIPSRDSWGYSVERGGSANSNEKDHWASHLDHPAIPPIPPNKTYNRDSWRPSAIGYAVTPASRNGTASTRAATATSPGDGQQTPKRPVSKLLPDRPDLPSHHSLSPPQRQPTQMASPLHHPSIRTVEPSFALEVQPNTPPLPQSLQQKTPTLPKLIIPKTRPINTNGSTLSYASPPPQQTYQPAPAPAQAEQPTQAKTAPTPYPDSTTSTSNWTAIPVDQPAIAELASPASTVEPTVSLAQTAIVGSATRVPHTPHPKAALQYPQLQATTYIPPVPAQKQTKIPAAINVNAPPPTQRKVMPSPLFSSHPNPRSASDPVVRTSHPTIQEQPNVQSQTEINERPPVERVQSNDSNITYISNSSEARITSFIPQPPEPVQANLSPVVESPFSEPKMSATIFPTTARAATASPTPRPGQMIPPPRRPIQYQINQVHPEEQQRYPHSPQDIVRPQAPFRVPSSGAISPSTGPRADDRGRLPSSNHQPRQMYPIHPPRGPGPNASGMPYPRGAQQGHRPNINLAASYNGQGSHNPHGRPQQRMVRGPGPKYPSPQMARPPVWQYPSGQASPNNLLEKRRGPSMAQDMMLNPPNGQPTSQALWQRQSHHYPAVPAALPPQNHNYKQPPYTPTPTDSSPSQGPGIRVTPMRRGQDLILDFN